jgi:hypothetical protein
MTRTSSDQRALLALMASAALVATPTAAAPPELRREPSSAPASDPARAYCEYVTNVAASEGALLRAPWLFASVGTLRGATALDDAAALSARDRELSLRLSAGLGFSPTRYYFAGLLEERARAQCERQRAERELRGLGTRGAEGVRRSALTAKIAILGAALPEAERLVRASRDALEASRTTLPEHGALELRVDDLRQRLADAELALAALPEPPDDTPPRASLAQLRRWTAEEQAVASKMRRAGALSLTLRGGYDEVFGVPQELPVFGSLTLEFNPGWFWQPALDERAERAHAESVAAEALGQNESLAALARRFAAELVVLRRRRAEVETNLADLGRRRERLIGAGSAAAREYSEHVWFEEVRWRADYAFLDEQVRALERLTSIGAPALP